MKKTEFERLETEDMEKPYGRDRLPWLTRHQETMLERGFEEWGYRVDYCDSKDPS